MEHLLGKDYVNKDLFAIKSYQITGATFKQSLISKVPLTSYMHKIAKLDEEPLITPSEEANIEASSDMSLSETSIHLILEPKAKTNKKRRKKKIPSSFEPNVSQDVSQTTISQASESQHAKEIEVQENIVIEDEHIADEQHDDTKFVDSRILSMGDVSLESLNKATDESPYDTESEIKFVQRFKPVPNDEEPLFKSVSNKESDTDTKESLSKPKLSKSEEKDADNVLDELADLRASADKPSESISHINSKSEEKDVDNVLDELADLQASADKPSDNISHLQQEITSLSTKVG
ncbi:hypothetical protein Tco_0715944 [Tanacetum coccineum]